MTKNSEYMHGGSPLEDIKRFGLDEKDVLDFSVSLNPLGPPAVIRENWMELLNLIEGYPSVGGEGIIDFYGKKFGIPQGDVMAGNGSTELIYLISRVLGFKRVAIITPSFHDYERASIISGAEVIKYGLSDEDAFSYPDVSMLIELFKNAEAMWIGRPNNPTGNILPKELAMELAGMFPEKMFIFDEAFIQFMEDWEDESLLMEKRIPNILVLHSLTKFYAVAGIRLGGLIGNDDIISIIKEKKEPWTVNNMAEKVAKLLIDCDDYERKSRSFIKVERERLVNKLGSIKRIAAFPSTANFILCEWQGTEDMDHLLKYLLLNGVYVRDCRNFEGLEKGFFRIGIRSVEENERLLSLLKSYTDGTGG